MIYRIEVWIALAAGRVLAGEMVCEIVAGSRNRGAFRYASDYLSRPDAFSLDPVSLPMREGDFAVDHPGVFGVFEDSLPDDWGRKLLVRKHRISPRQQLSKRSLLPLRIGGRSSLLAVCRLRTLSVLGKSMTTCSAERRSKTVNII